MKVKHIRHLPLFEHLSQDQDEEDVKEVDHLPYFELISELELQNHNADKQFELPLNLTDDNCWPEIERALSTCAYLGTDDVAVKLIAESLWAKSKGQLDPILNFETSCRKLGNFPFLSNYLQVYFKISKDEFDKIDAGTRVEHCWTDKEIHPTIITTADAAAYGNLNALVNLHANDSLWNVDTCYMEAANGHLECLRYAHENGSPWRRYHYDCICDVAAEKGHLECLKYAHENGCLWNEITCAEAARHGHLQCLSYLHENGCPWNSSTCWVAASNGHLHCLMYAHENGAYWSEVTCCSAASNGQLECLRYLHENGCPWDALTCVAAAQKGHLHCLIYARENGCPWEVSSLGAVERIHPNCLTYVREHL